MEFALSEEQVLLQDSIGKYLSENAPLDRVRAFAEEMTDGDIWQGLVELGVPSLLVTEANGGVGLGVLDAALVAETLGRFATPSPYLGSAVILPSLLQRLDDTDDALLAECMSGSMRCGLALAGISGARQETGVTATNDRLSGRCLFVIDHPADRYLVATDDRSLFLIDANTSDVELRALTTVDITRPIGELTLDNVAGQRLTDDPAQAQHCLDLARVMLAADSLGAAQHMLDEAVAYAKQREQFNRPIASFQAVKHMCAEMAAELEPCRAMVWYAAHLFDENSDEVSLYACHTKAHLAEVGQFVGKTATEVHGGMGFTDLLGLHYWFKRLAYNRQLLGSPEYLREQAAKLQGLVAA